MKTEELLVPATLTVNEAIWKFPLTVAVFHAHGIDACCGGGLTIAEAARRHSIDLPALLEELSRSAERWG